MTAPGRSSGTNLRNGLRIRARAGRNAALAALTCDSCADWLDDFLPVLEEPIHAAAGATFASVRSGKNADLHTGHSGADRAWAEGAHNHRTAGSSAAPNLREADDATRPPVLSLVPLAAACFGESAAQ